MNVRKQEISNRRFEAARLYEGNFAPQERQEATLKELGKGNGESELERYT